MKQEKNNQTPTVIHFNYEGNPVSFSTDNGIMVNATEMAKPFGKQPIDFLKNQQTTEFLDELSKLRILSLENLVKVQKGGANPGTWMHEDVALEFARWLSPKFGIWCNDRIKELLTKGQTSIGNNQSASLPSYNADLEERMHDLENLVRSIAKMHCDTLEEHYSWQGDVIEIRENYQKLREDLVLSDEYMPVYHKLKEKTIQLEEIIEDKKRIIELILKQLDVETIKNKRLQMELDKWQ